MQEFYDDDYVEPGLTTELPDDRTLDELIRTEFKGSAKDFSYHIRMMQALGVPTGATMLDYGANWGYASWQFQRAGFDVQSFEISRPRAAFGEKLGLRIATSLTDVRPPFDLIYSCHVLEHVPNPQETIESMLAMLKPGGLVVGQTPNGSPAFRDADRRHFQNIWGQVHPVLLTDGFVKRIAGSRPFLICSDDHPDYLRTWDGQSQEHRDCSRDGLFFAIRNTSA
jgi:SAM-dependent methyltransferase